MNHLSDNLRDFPERPLDVANWKKKQDFYLTLSVVMASQEGKPVEKIKEIQERIIGQMSNISEYDDPYSADGLYKYPTDTFHFSLINFLKCDLSAEGDFKNFKNTFEEFRKFLNQYDQYKNFLILVKKFLEKKINNNLSSVAAETRWIETGDKNRALDSFSLQVFPNPSFIEKLESMTKEFKQEFSGADINLCGVDSTLKAYPKNPKESPVRFALNILRFITDNNVSEKNKTRTKNIVETINREHNNKVFEEFEITHLSLVESDPFLFNKFPETEGYPLNKS